MPLLISLSILATAAGCYFLIPDFRQWINEAFEILTSKDEARIKSWVEQFGMGGPIVLIVVMVVQMFLFVVPNVLVMMIAITAYGPVWGSVISLIGVFASSSFGYVIGRYVSPAIVNRFMSAGAQQKISSFIHDYGVPAIAITRLSSLSNDSLSFVTGMLKMAYHRYILATLAGITPLIVLLAIYGNNGRIERALIWIAGISLVLLSIYIILRQRKKK